MGRAGVSVIDDAKAAFVDAYAADVKRRALAVVVAFVVAWAAFGKGKSK